MLFLATFLNLSLPDTLSKYLDPPAPPDKAFRGPKHLLTAAVCCFWLLNFLFAKHLVNEESSPGFLERAMPYESLQCMFGVLGFVFVVVVVVVVAVVVLVALVDLLLSFAGIWSSIANLLITISSESDRVIGSPKSDTYPKNPGMSDWKGRKPVNSYSFRMGVLDP